MNYVLNEVIGIFSHTVDKKIILKQNFNANNSIVNGDPSQLQNAILNIAINARDAMPNGGILNFITDIKNLDNHYIDNLTYEMVPGEYIQICITDSGSGMDTEILKHIFEPFLQQKTKRREPVWAFLLHMVF